jgi:hypothetical protein
MVELKWQRPADGILLLLSMATANVRRERHLADGPLIVRRNIDMAAAVNFPEFVTVLLLWKMLVPSSIKSSSPFDSEPPVHGEILFARQRACGRGWNSLIAKRSDREPLVGLQLSRIARRVSGH